MVSGVHHFARMNGECDQCRTQTFGCRYLLHLLNQIAMSHVYSVKETDGSYAWFGNHSRCVIYNLHTYILIFF